MADLSHLGGLNPVEALDLDGTYPSTQKKSFVLPPKGVYQLRVGEITPESITRTKGGSLQFQIDPTIADGPFEGKQLKYTKISAKTFQRKGALASQVGDFLKACGFTGVLRNEQEIADAVEATAGSYFEALVDWRGYNKRTQWDIEGMEKFPKNADGTYQPWITDPREVGKTDDEGRELRVFANLYIPIGGFVTK